MELGLLMYNHFDLWVTIQTKVWVDFNDPNDFLNQQSVEWQPGATAKIVGTLKAFGGKRNLSASNISTVIDFNMLTLHFLDVIFVHCYNTQGPLSGDQLEAHHNQTAQQQIQHQEQPQQVQQDQSIYTELQQYVRIRFYELLLIWD